MNLNINVRHCFSYWPCDFVLKIHLKDAFTIIQEFRLTLVIQ